MGWRRFSRIASLLKKPRKFATENFETVVVVLSVLVGTLAAVASAFSANAEVNPDFYATIAQILPVFLIALAVEQKLVHRLGISEDEYVARAQRTTDLVVEAQVFYENGEEEEGKRIELLLDGEPEYQWVGRHALDLMYSGGREDAPDIEGLARRRYRNRRWNEAVFVAGSVAVLVLGEVAALQGLLLGGTSSCSPLLWLATGSTAATFLAISLGGAREIVESIRG